MKYLDVKIVSINGGVNVSWKTDQLDGNQENIWTENQHITPGTYKKHIITEQDLIDNPDWVAQVRQAGQTIEVTNDVLSTLAGIKEWLKGYMDDFNKNQTMAEDVEVPAEITAVLNQPLNLI